MSTQNRVSRLYLESRRADVNERIVHHVNLAPYLRDSCVADIDSTLYDPLPRVPIAQQAKCLLLRDLHWH
jgi:hypothetical protein